MSEFVKSSVRSWADTLVSTDAPRWLRRRGVDVAKAWADGYNAAVSNYVAEVNAALMREQGGEK